MPTSELPDFEKQRLENIAQRDALLKQLSLDAQSSGFFPKPTPSTASRPKQARATSKKKKEATKIKKKLKAEKEEEAENAPRRTSSRLRGIAADSEVIERKANKESEAEQRERKIRKTDSFSFDDMVVSGNGGVLADGDVLTRGVASPKNKRTVTREDSRRTTDKELRALREELSGLNLWEAWEPNSSLPFFFFFWPFLSNFFLMILSRNQNHPGEDIHNDLPPIREETAGFCRR